MAHTIIIYFIIMYMYYNILSKKYIDTLYELAYNYNIS